MIRITELRLAIDHAPEALEAAIVRFLKITPKDVISFAVFKRSYDARKNVALAFIYTVDVSVKDEEQVLSSLCWQCSCTTIAGYALSLYSESTPKNGAAASRHWFWPLRYFCSAAACANGL
jgi:uncharacterized FAD-dependent dehydrogenase